MHETTIQAVLLFYAKWFCGQNLHNQAQNDHGNFQAHSCAKKSQFCIDKPMWFKFNDCQVVKYEVQVSQLQNWPMTMSKSENISVSTQQVL